MPTYEYECEECKHVFEIFQSMSDDPVESCPECSGDVRRVIHGGAGLVFKGSGFYITDSRNSGQSGSGGQGSSSSAPCKKGEKPCADSCPAAEDS